MIYVLLLIAEFRKLPPHIKVKFPIFSPQKIDRDQISQCFGTLSSLSFTTEDQVFSSETPETESSHLERPLMNEPFIITTIKCKYNSLFHVACQEDDKVWTSGQDNMIKLYNLQGELLNSIQTKSGSIDPVMYQLPMVGILCTPMIKTRV